MPAEARLEAGLCDAKGQDDLVLFLPLVRFLVSLNRAILVDNDRHPFPQFVNRNNFPVQKVSLAFFENLTSAATLGFFKERVFKLFIVPSSIDASFPEVRSEYSLWIKLVTARIVNF